jgi:hypothetical protein
MFGAEFVAVPVVDGANFRCSFGCSAERRMTLLAAPFGPHDHFVRMAAQAWSVPESRKG